MTETHHDPAAELTNDPLPQEPMTELGHAHRFVEVFEHQVRYVPSWKKWLVWDGTRWEQDTTNRPTRWMAAIARTVTAHAIASGDKSATQGAKRLESRSSVAGALALASAQQQLVVDYRVLDADPFLLNCRNGTLDLRTDELRPHDPADLLTKVAGAAYEPDAKSAEFDRFLSEIQPSEEMQQYVACLLGHALEGRQVTHILPIFVGPGANGKTTLINQVKLALGEYAGEAAPGLLIARHFDQHPTEVADLHGLRLVTLQETDRNRNLAEATVKRLTGGDRVKARRMGQDFWEFVPSHTFVMVTNHKPIVQGTDEGIWRRLQIVPFSVRITKEDEALPDRLALDAEATLAWLVDGYRSWKADGLVQPAAVVTATEEYRKESDVLGRFLSERCEQVLTDETRSAILYHAFEDWCDSNGERPGTQMAFSTELTNRGYDKKHTRHGKVWKGLRLVDGDEV